MKTTPMPIKITDRVVPRFLFKGVVGQDGAIYGDLMFRFEKDGACTVYSLSGQTQAGEFSLCSDAVPTPHCNTVCFGSERFDDADEFPLLYCNVYNNYAKADDRLEGVCCVYRLTREGGVFTAAPVQIIRIGFVDDLTLWKSLPDNGDKRPYGNFVPDVTTGKLYVYTMRDKEKQMRYFEFDLPRLGDGTYSDDFGVNVVTLAESDIKSGFDCEHYNFIQGGCAYDGLLFSIEGGTVGSAGIPYSPCLCVIDTAAKKQLACIDLPAAGLTIEPELIDFAGDTIYYMDSSGAVYTLEFC